jgi:hypothetical protein
VGEGEGVVEGAAEFDGTEVTLLPAHAARTAAAAIAKATDRMIMTAAVLPGRRNGG